jgi:hypothetical protein
VELVNASTAYQWWPNYLDINGVAMRGTPAKQGWEFSRHGYLAAQEDPTLDADKFGAMIRRSLRPLSKPTLEAARGEYARREVRAFPRYFIIEPNASCNRKCVFCPIIVTNRKGNMKWEHFIRLMAECSHYDVYGISLYQLSEPMLWRGRQETGQWDDDAGQPIYRHFDIADMVNHAKAIGHFKAVNISTNGDAPNLNRLLTCDLDDLFISIDGTTAEVYDQNRPSTKANDTGAFQRTVDRVRAFLEKKAATGQSKPWCRLQIINNALCAPQVLDFVRQWIDTPGVDDVYVKNLDGMNAWLGDKAVSAAESAVKMAKVASMPCQHLYAIGSVVADGRYNACCHDSLTELTTAGANVAAMPFADWWNGDYMRELRAEHEGGAQRLPCKLCAERDPWLGA